MACAMEKLVMMERMIQLLKEHHTCVLATCSENRPHCSLMAYVADDSGRVVYMIAQRRSRKYKNMLENPLVSFLVDTRQGKDLSRMSTVCALTVHGTFSVLTDPIKRTDALNRLLGMHPHLKGVAEAPDTEVFVVEVASFLLLDGPVDAYFQSL